MFGSTLCCILDQDFLPLNKHVLLLFMGPTFSFHNEKDHGNLLLTIFILEIVLFSLWFLKKIF